jgi:hypothetical protein
MNPGDFMIVFSLEAELTRVRAGVSQTSSCRKRHKRRARLRSNGTATNETARARWPSSIRVEHRVDRGQPCETDLANPLLSSA